MKDETMAMAKARTWQLALALLALTMMVALLAPSEAEARPENQRLFRLTLLHFNDGESELLAADEFGGVDRFVKLARQQHRSAARFGADIMVSSGDNFLAGPDFSASLAAGPPFYDSQALSQLPVDAFILGNHDFDFGPDVLADFIEGVDRKPTNPPFLSANLDLSGEPRLAALEEQGRIAPSTVVTRWGRQIGIVGATTPDLPAISSPRNVVVDDDVAGIVQAEIDALTADGVDIIIVVSHLQGINADLELLPQLSGVDLMVAGGGDELLANDDTLLIPGDEEDVFASYPIYADNADGVEVPIVTTSGQYRYLGKLVTFFDADGNLVKIGPASDITRVSSIAPDVTGRNLYVTRRILKKVEAHLEDLATNVIGTSQVDLNGVRGDIRTVETNQGNLIADSLLWQGTELAAEFGIDPPDISLANGGGIRNDSVLPSGPVTELDTFDMLPFPNFVTVVHAVPRDQVKEILENAVSRIEDVNGRYAQVGGFTMEIDLDGTAQELDEDGNVVVAGSRVRTMTLDDGTPIIVEGAVVAGDGIDIATVDFLARGGDEYPYRDAAFTTLGVSYQQGLASYISGPLAGVISSADYPEGGEGRVTRQ